MGNFMARVAYWWSLLCDQSESPVCYGRQKERDARLRRRIGTKAFKQFEKSNTARDPAFYASMLPIPLFFVLIFLLFVKLAG